MKNKSIEIGVWKCPGIPVMVRLGKHKTVKETLRKFFELTGTSRWKRGWIRSTCDFTLDSSGDQVLPRDTKLRLKSHEILLITNRIMGAPEYDKAYIDKLRTKGGK